MPNYARILSRIHNQPLAIAQDKLDIITSKVIVPILLSEKVQSDVSVAPIGRDSSLVNRNDTAVINIFDSLVSKGGAGESGYTSYQSIQGKIDRAIEAGAKTLVFYHDSPGGEVSGLFGLANYIHSLPEKYGVRTVSITDGMSASADYVLSSATQESYATASSIIGSIGVIMTRVNVTKMDEKMGVEYQILRSKSEKALGNPHEPVSDKATEDAKAMLAALDTQMNENVHRFRPSLSIDTIMQLNGNTVLAEEAVKLGLIDGIVSSFTEGLSKVKEGRKFNFVNTTGANMPRTLEEYQAEEQRLLGEVNKLKGEQSTLIKEAVKGEQDRILGIIDAGEKFKISSTAIKKRITANTSMSDAVSMFEDIAEATQTKTEIPITGLNTTINSQTVNMSSEDQFVANLLAGVEELNKQTKVELR
jgi:ClpP class serine protease